MIDNKISGLRDLSPDTKTKTSAPPPHNHSVQFYESDHFLVNSVAAYFHAGLAAGESVIFIATEAHREAVEKQLETSGLDLAALSMAGRYFALDAAETLSRFMEEGSPHPRLFANAISPVLERAGARDRKVRAFGEMVAILWAQGNKSAAIRLEELWNEIAQTHSFALMCAYPLGEFAGESHSENFQHICAAHSHVRPAESFANGAKTEADRSREIARLQQKAISLERELIKRKAAEDELCDFLENATEPIHKVSEDGTILWANRAELEFLGYPVEEYIGQRIAKFHADSDVIADIFARLKRGEKLANYEARLLHKDGSIRIVAINSSVYWQGEDFRYTRCFSRDITASRLQREMLERMVAERTAELTEKIGDLEAFSYSVSHDMRSPLRAMQGYSKALLEDYAGKLDETAVDRLQRILRAAHRLDLLVRDVLSYSKISQGQCELKPVCLATLMHDLFHSHPEYDAEAGRISVGELHSVIGNEAYLAQCFTNLIDNALKFSRPGHPSRVSISSERIGNKIRVSVADDGIGILPEHYDRLFQIFGRIYSDKTYEGTGIGLAIVKKAVSRMGGEIGFESEFGGGSRFWFTLQGA